MMKFIGAHVSASESVSRAPINAHAIGAQAFALFTRNPSRWKSSPIPESEAEQFKANCQEFGYTPDRILPHDSYLINLGAPDKQKLHMSRDAFLDEMRRCEQLGLTMLNFHPGSHLKLITPDECLDLIADSINHILDKTSGVKAVIENTAGQGSNLGYSFEQLAHIIDKVEDKSRVGICIDTCHAYSAGYDLATEEGYERTWQEFDRIIGMKYLSGMHINDSKRPLDARIDRHESLSKGTLGDRFFKMLMTDDRLDGLPMILETPDETLWAQAIQWLYSLTTNN